MEVTLTLKIFEKIDYAQQQEDAGRSRDFIRLEHNDTLVPCLLVSRTLALTW